MKIETALRHAAEIARRLESVNGFIPTPRGEHEFYLVKKAWVFGSTIKGNDSPSDLDVLLFAENAGAQQKWEVVGFSPRYLRSYGIYQTRSTSGEGKRWLRKGMKMISIHDTVSERAIFDTKIEIYPRFLLNDKTHNLQLQTTKKL